MKPRPPQQLRIIGGQWRSRRLIFPDLPHLRPTPDRVRETLFNWLAPVLLGTHCLDLCAGSGALGIEALSRHAASALFVEEHYLAVRSLRENLARLSAPAAQVVASEVLTWLQQAPPRTFHVVFADPPFASDLLQPICQRLEQGGWLTDPAWIYLEAAADQPPPLLPATWHLHREKRANAVAYRLFQRHSCPAIAHSG